MTHLWDYKKEKLKKSKKGRLLLLERQINYGIYAGDKEKLDLEKIKENWHQLNIEPKRRRFLKLLIWEK